MNSHSVARGKLSSTRTPVNSGAGISSGCQTIGVRRERAVTSGTVFWRGEAWDLRSASYSARCFTTKASYQDRKHQQQNFIGKPVFEQHRSQSRAAPDNQLRPALRLDAANALDDVRR